MHPSNSTCPPLVRRAALGLLLALTALASPAQTLRASGTELKDEHGRTMMLRGVSVSGSAKLPAREAPDGTLSFVGRPFPLDEADAHFERLRGWGFNTVRLVVTWEAVEHAGPGRYDQAYLHYLRALVSKAGDHDLMVLIDPHQDAWSRFTGGDGAPRWTLEAIGIDTARLETTGAAITSTDPSYRHMMWTGNYVRYGAATMFTLFFGGNDFAPRLRVDGAPVQEFLQGHFIRAMQQVAHAVKGLPNVIGFGTMNEPGRGYIGVGDLQAVPAALPAFGATPTPLQAMAAAAGHAQEVPVLALQGPPVGTAVLNPQRQPLWGEGAPPVWQQHGVWNARDGQPQVRQPRYFSEVRGRQVDFVAHYLMPFIDRYTDAIREVMPGALVFVDPVAVLGRPDLQPRLPRTGRRGMVLAPKWYDGPTHVTNSFYPWLDDAGRRGAMQGFAAQLAKVEAEAGQQAPGRPVMVGEFGLGMGIDGGAAFRSGDYALRGRVLASYYDAMDARLLSALAWNYTPDNTHAAGDGWNGEDLSLFSRDDAPGNEHRALAAIRPYAAATSGRPALMRFDHATGEFEYVFRPDPALQQPTDITLPAVRYPKGMRVQVTGGRYEEDPATQMLRVWAHPGAETVRVQVQPAAP